MTKDEIIARIAGINKALKQIEEECDKFHYTVVVRHESTKHVIDYIDVPKQTLMMCFSRRKRVSWSGIKGDVE